MSAIPSESPAAPDDPEPTLQDIFSAVTNCNMSLSALTDEVKGVKTEITFVRQDIQKLRERAEALEGRVNSLEGDMAPMKRDLSYNVPLTSQAG